MHKFWRLLQPYLLALLALIWLSGCASYSDSMREAHSAVATSQWAHAEEVINKTLEAENSDHVPQELESDAILLLLERATVLQAQGRYDLAARDMQIVDDRMVFLEIADADSVNLAKYLYSDDSKDYVAPAYERLLVNSINMLNFMAQGDIQGAKVEARRFTVMEQFYLEADGPTVLNGIIALGNFLSGVAFEHSREYSEAVRYYSRAWYFGIRSAEFHERLVDLLAVTGYQAADLKNHDPDALEELITAAKGRQGLTATDYREGYLNGDTLIVMQTGLSPWRRAERVPIGAAMRFTQSARGVSSDDFSALSLFVSSNGIETLNFPMLTTRGLPADKPVNLVLNGAEEPIEIYVDIGTQVATEYAEMVPGLMAAALTRMMTRSVAGAATGAAVDHLADSAGLGALASLGVQLGMSAADTPDTRSWMTLPGGIRLARVNLTDEVHSIQLNVGGQTDSREIQIHKDSLNFLNFSRLR